MRFAYIDSNGNEVPIPSVDALALRIELGAISENTELYDAQADQWGPAHTHEIFHTLSRTSGGDSGFVAPPPVVPPPASPTPSVEEGALAQDAETETEPVGEVAESVDAGPDLALEAPAEEPAAAGLTLADPTEEEDEAEVEASGGLQDLDLDLAPALESLESDADEVTLDLVTPAAGTDVESEDDDDEEDEDAPAGAFDFGDMDGGLEMEVVEPDGGDESPLAAPMELESAMDFGSEGMDVGGGGSLALETPMSEFNPESPPAWMEQDGSDTGAAGDDVMDFSTVGGESEVAGSTDDVPLRERRTPRNKPSRPKHRRQYSLVGRIAGVVIVLSIGVGGYFAWPVVSGLLAGSNEPDNPPVFIPDLPAELMPQMQGVAEAALAATFAEVRSGWLSSNPLASPSSDWLAGVYLGNASRFDDVEGFWNGMYDFLTGIRAIDLTAFDAALGAEMGSLSVTDADRSLMLARADSGFVAGTAARAAMHDQVERLIDAALELHTFLVANESNIEYVPASSITTDPILEASPSTPEIRTAMEDLIDAVTGALSDLNYRDLVTAEGLWATVLAQVQEVSIQ